MNDETNDALANSDVDEAGEDAVAVALAEIEAARAEMPEDVDGAEEQTVIDQGLFVATDRRGVFVGQRQVREFPWEKLLAVQLGVLTRKSLVLYLPVTNRQKVSGIAGDWDTMLDVPTFVQLGVGLAQEGESRLLARLRDELADLYANEPPRSP